jgi:hypothetical protein
MVLPADQEQDDAPQLDDEQPQGLVSIGSLNVKLTEVRERETPVAPLAGFVLTTLGLPAAAKTGAVSNTTPINTIADNMKDICRNLILLSSLWLMVWVFFIAVTT